MNEETEFCRTLESVRNELATLAQEGEEEIYANDFRLLRRILQKQGASLLARHLPIRVQRRGNLVQLCCDEEELRKRNKKDEKRSDDRPPDLLFQNLHDTSFGSTDSDTSMIERIAKLCNGIIFDQDDNCNIMALPFPRLSLTSSSVSDSYGT